VANYFCLNALVDQVDDTDFVVLGLPCNQFGMQEPGTNPELLNGIKYVRPGDEYVPKFNITAKVEVNGENQIPLYSFLKSTCPNPSLTIGDPSRLYWTPIKQHDLTWNFEKFLINQDGRPVKRYAPAVLPQDIFDDIDGLLDESREVTQEQGTSQDQGQDKGSSKHEATDTKKISPSKRKRKRSFP